MNQAEGEDGERRHFPRRPAKAHAGQTSKRANVDGTTLLHAASERDHAEVVDQLLSCRSPSGMHVMRADEAGRTALDVGMSPSVDDAGGRSAQGHRACVFVLDEGVDTKQTRGFLLLARSGDRPMPAGAPRGMPRVQAAERPGDARLHSLPS